MIARFSTGRTSELSVDEAQEFLARSADLLEIDQPVAHGVAIAERHYCGAARSMCPQIENFVELPGTEAFHRRRIDFFLGCCDQRHAKPDKGLARCMLEIRVRPP